MAEAKKTDAVEKKTVKIRIPREKGNNADVFVWVNEKTWLIKRGEEVEVPECVAEVLRNREIALEDAYAFNSEVSN